MPAISTPSEDSADGVTSPNRSSSGTDGRPLVIIYAGGFGFQINGDTFGSGDQAVFFTNLSNVQAWYGGFREELLER